MLRLKLFVLIMRLNLLVMIVKSCLPNKGLLKKNDAFILHNKMVVQGKHKDLLQIARSLTFQAKLTKILSGDSILVATFIRNRLLSSLLNWKNFFWIAFENFTWFWYLKGFWLLILCHKYWPSQRQIWSVSSGICLRWYKSSKNG